MASRSLSNSDTGLDNPTGNYFSAPPVKAVQLRGPKYRFPSRASVDNFRPPRIPENNEDIQVRIGSGDSRCIRAEKNNSFRLKLFCNAVPQIQYALFVNHSHRSPLPIIPVVCNLASAKRSYPALGEIDR